MAASRCITSFVRSCPLNIQRVSPQYHRLARPHIRLFSNQHPPSLLSRSLINASNNFRWLSQQSKDSESQKSGSGSILGSVQGLGLAGEVLKKQQEEAQSDGKKEEKSSSEEDSEAAKKKKDAEASWRALQYSMIFIGVTFSGLAGYLIVVWGAPGRDEEGNLIEDKFSSKPIPLQYLMRSWDAMMNYSKMIQDPSWDKLLPDPLTGQYYQPPYTLILEMNGVLVHPDWTYQTGWRFKKRPGTDFFLSQVCSPVFEVVVYTAEQAFTAFPILDALDPQGAYISYRLFRDATRYVDGHHVKDLDCINRDLSKVIVIDWNSKSVQYHPRNVLKIKQWKGTDDDRALFDLAILLRTIASMDVKDVREVLDFYNQFDDPIEAFRENQRKLMEQQELVEKMNQEKQTRPATSMARSIFGRRQF